MWLFRRRWHANAAGFHVSFPCGTLGWCYAVIVVFTVKKTKGVKKCLPYCGISVLKGLLWVIWGEVACSESFLFHCCVLQLEMSLSDWWEWTQNSETVVLIGNKNSLKDAEIHGKTPLTIKKTYRIYVSEIQHGNNLQLVTILILKD